MAESFEDHLVPGRGCGACLVCCTDLTIESPELTKPAGVRCGNCLAGGGCAIYDARPQPCRDFYCLWRIMGDLEDFWRPDRCGILMRPGQLPPDFAGQAAIDLHLVGSPDILDTPEFIAFIVAYIESGLALFLCVPVTKGVQDVRTFLNPALVDAIANQDVLEIRNRLGFIYANSVGHRPPVPQPALVTPPSYRIGGGGSAQWAGGGYYRR